MRTRRVDSGCHTIGFHGARVAQRAGRGPVERLVRRRAITAAHQRYPMFHDEQLDPARSCLLRLRPTRFRISRSWLRSQMRLIHHRPPRIAFQRTTGPMVEQCASSTRVRANTFCRDRLRKPPYEAGVNRLLVRPSRFQQASRTKRRLQIRLLRSSPLAKTRETRTLQYRIRQATPRWPRSLPLPIPRAKPEGRLERTSSSWSVSRSRGPRGLPGALSAVREGLPWPKPPPQWPMDTK